MTDTKPGADELQARDRLRELLGETPSAADPASDPNPEDWWELLYAADEPPTKASAPRRRRHAKPTVAQAEPDDEESEGDAGPDEESDPAPASAPRPASPQRARHVKSQSLLDAWASIAPRTRWLIYHGTAAAFGWGLGIVSWATHVTAWIAADRWTDPQSITCYALALGVVALYRRTRLWWWPVAWMAAVPAASIVTGVLLYAPNS